MKNVHNFIEILKEKDHFGDLAVVGRIILKSQTSS
jgi:hypothetical protein